MQTLLTYQYQGRNRRTALSVAAVLAGLSGLVLVFQAAWWIIAGLALFTLPAIWDLVSNRTAGLTLTETALHWHSGRRGDKIALHRIRTIRLDRRLDLTTRVSVVLQDSRRIRLPDDCLPDLDQLAAALARAAVKTERHPFSLL